VPAASSRSLIANTESVSRVPQSGWSKLMSVFTIHSGWPKSLRLVSSPE
jgi:hypothetical protein